MLFRNDKKDPQGSSGDDLRVPLLPLRDIIVFPHMVVPLFVGRPKSIRALEEAVNKQKFVLLAAQKDAKTNEPAEDDIYTLGTLGTVVPGFEVKVCDDDGRELGAGEVGMLWVRGDSRALGYWQQMEKTKSAFRGEWYVSGDLVSRDADGYFTYCGRADELLKVGGKWLAPQEVESCLLQHPLVSRQHCELYESAGQLMVRDLGSLNGTFVNNQRVTESPLPAGELLTVGTVTFRAVYEAAPGESDAAPAKSKLDATTVDARKPAKQPTPPPDDDAPLEFDFGKPLMPGEDDLTEHPTEQLEATLEETPKPSKDKTRGSAPPKPGPPEGSLANNG